MKAVTITVSLNPELAEFAQEDAAARGCDSMGDYMRGLIHRRRKEQVAADAALLGESIKGAPIGDPSEQEMAKIIAIQRRVRKNKRQ